MVVEPVTQCVRAVLDWELSTLGDPLTDLFTLTFTHYLPSVGQMFQGLAEHSPTQLRALGIPTVRDICDAYTAQMHLPPLTDQQITFYTAFVLFRFAAILQGVYKRSLQGRSCCHCHALSVAAFILLRLQVKQAPVKRPN
jgi:acyl-CoA dehydrogenase family protein 10